jgi:hypothetical protein
VGHPIQTQSYYSNINKFTNKVCQNHLFTCIIVQSYRVDCYIEKISWNCHRNLKEQWNCNSLVSLMKVNCTKTSDDDTQPATTSSYTCQQQQSFIWLFFSYLNPSVCLSALNLSVHASRLIVFLFSLSLSYSVSLIWNSCFSSFLTELFF